MAAAAAAGAGPGDYQGVWICSILPTLCCLQPGPHRLSLTVHDLSFLPGAEYFVPGFCEYLEGAVSRAVRRARHILADSESTRRDLVDLLGVVPERVTVLYPGVEPRFQAMSEAEG